MLLIAAVITLTTQIQTAPIARGQQIQQQIDNKKAAEEAARLEAIKQAEEAKARQSQAQAPEPVKTPVKTPSVAGCGDNQYANYIYMHESGCRLDARNAGGCLGIGQACPGSKLLAVCPDLNYACQNAFFTSYANSAYGGWAGAYQAWLGKHWW